MSEKQFHDEAKAFVRKVIRTRKHLINKGFNHVVNAPVIVDKLEKQLNYWPYCTNETMARFISNYKLEISAIIPGGKCRAGVVFSQQLVEFSIKSYKILYPNENIC